jgi:hypothetical protein
VQWHPYFANLLRPLVEGSYEVQTDVPVGDLPRRSDITLVRKTSDAPPPFRGLWSRLTAWNVLEYKGPTVSPRFDELHDLLELGLGIHRRLNEMQAKARLPEVDYAETSFWYLVNHIGRRFRTGLQQYLRDIERVTAGIWQARVYGHPVLLVSVRELQVERDSMALHVLAGVPRDQRKTIVEVLKAEPALWTHYGAWIELKEPEIWQEISQMASKKKLVEDYGPFIAILKETNNLKRFLEGIGAEQALAAFGEEEILANLPPERREKLRQMLQQQSAPAGKPKKG